MSADRSTANLGMRFTKAVARGVLPPTARLRLRQALGRKANQQPEWWLTLQALGSDSDNKWIRKSAEIEGALFQGEHELLWDLAVRNMQGDVLEIGSFMGKSTCILAGACIERGDGSLVVAVDPFDMAGTQVQVQEQREIVRGSPGTFYQFVSNARRLGFYRSVLPLATYSTIGLARGSWRFRMVFIDATHDFDGVAADVELASHFLHVGGILALHDASGGHWPGIERYVSENLNRDPRFRQFAEAGTIVVYERVT